MTAVLVVVVCVDVVVGGRTSDVLSISASDRALGGRGTMFYLTYDE